jgi:predicted regulator of Ras-like GTPase activity (Roadblock/LC7/MglB family)
MALSNQERSTRVEKILGSVTSLRGVTAAAIIDSDGFVTHVRRDFDINTDALGAAVQITFGSARRASDHVAQGATQLMLVENKDGLVMLAPLNQGFVLALVADESAMLGAVRYEVKQTVPELNQLFAS